MRQILIAHKNAVSTRVFSKHDADYLKNRISLAKRGDLQEPHAQYTIR